MVSSIGVQETLATAAQEGVQSDRLVSLNSQAERRLPSAVALSVAGRLTQFGYDVNGTMTKDFEPLPIANRASSAGHTEIGPATGAGSRAQPRPCPAVAGKGETGAGGIQASDQARSEECSTPGSAAAWGNSYSMITRRRSAIFAKGALTRSDFNRRGMNLAVTLAEEGRRNDAIAVWQKLLQQSLSDSDRSLANRGAQFTHAEERLTNGRGLAHLCSLRSNICLSPAPRPFC